MIKVPELNKEEIEIEKMLVVSTGHMTYKDSLQLEQEVRERECGAHIIIVNKVPYGWDVHLDQDEASIALEREAVSKRFSKSFGQVLEVARDNGCKWVKFDCDGPFYNGLRQFNW